LLAKHQVTQWEVEDVLLNFPEYRFVERGRRKDEDVYAALGQTASGRYLMIYFIRKPQNSAFEIWTKEEDSMSDNNVQQLTSEGALLGGIPTVLPITGIRHMRF
jgi:hypothetical protein